MKQMPPNLNNRFSFQPFQPTGNMMQWTPYQQVTQSMQNPGVLAEATPKTGLMGLLKKINPVSGNLTETLDQIQNLIKMTQSVAPKIQEYGPLIKNLPNMLALMKEFNEAEEEETNNETDEADVENDSTDELDKILGLDQTKEQEQDNKVSKTQVHEDEKTKDNIDDTLFKIETMDDNKEKPKYKGPTLYI
ncbi:VrrA/YqfQ family protein [Amphibacillus sp. Q70]|uniref:VrrA/YqfQ family protein n=1 Tax=Amphibacillus sp. Q70 TaxID=3453416 RepID=UPI003F837267